MTRIGRLVGAQRLLIAIGLVFAWPAVIDGTPFFFSDTTSYIRSIDALAVKLTGRTTPWSDVVRPADAAQRSGGGARPSSFDKNILLGRSLFYGALLYAGAALGFLLLPVLVQALLAGATLVGITRHVVDPAGGKAFVLRALIVALAAALTTLPFFVSFLMPDVFAGLGLAAAVTVMSGWTRERAGWRLFWFALLVFAALVHSSHLLLLAGLGVVSAIARLALGARTRLDWMGIGAVLAAVIVGAVADAGVSTGIGLVTHRPAIRPPFLAMRLIADGPGAAYLAATCPQSGFALCAYRGRHTRSSDVLMWSADPSQGIFTAAGAADQRRIAAEQLRFAAAVVARYPGETLRTGMNDVAQQIGAIGLREFATPVLADPAVAARLPSAVRSGIARSPAARGAFPFAPYEALVLLLTAGGLVTLLVAAVRVRGAVAARVGLLLAGVMINDIVCGAISVPSDRYQARLIWLVPVYAVLLWRKAWSRRAAEVDQALA